MVDTLVFVSFDLKCPYEKQLNEQLRTVAEYRWMNNDYFFLVGLRCELKDGSTCTENTDCPQRANLPLTLLPIDLSKQDFYLCYANYEEKENGRTKVVADCKEQYKLKKARSGA